MGLGELQDLMRQARNEDARLDVLFQTFDDLHYRGEFQTADDLLKGLDPVDLGENLTVGVLTITFAAAKHLPSRVEFLQQASSVYPEGAVKGL